MTATRRAGVDTKQLALRPDFAIDYKTIPTVPAADLIVGYFDRSEVKGKTVVISTDAADMPEAYLILRPGQASSVYFLILAAEKLKAGVAREFGYLISLLFCTVIGLACVLRSTRRERNAILIAGAVGLLMLMLIGDRLKLHFEIMSAVIAPSIFGIRDVLRGNVYRADDNQCRV